MSFRRPFFLLFSVRCTESSQEHMEDGWIKCYAKSPTGRALLMRAATICVDSHQLQRPRALADQLRRRRSFEEHLEAE